MSNNSDFIRPRGIEEGVLLNTNNDALQAYKKAKSRLNKMAMLERQVEDLQAKYDRIIQLIDK